MPAAEEGYSDGGHDMPHSELGFAGTARSPAPTAIDAAGAAGEAGQLEKKKRRRRKKLDAPTVAHFMRLQQGRGPVRKWVRKWVSVPSLIGGGDMMMLKWVTDQPLATAAGPSLEQLQDADFLLPDEAAGATPSVSRSLPSQVPPQHQGTPLNQLHLHQQQWTPQQQQIPQPDRFGAPGQRQESPGNTPGATVAAGIGSHGGSGAGSAPELASAALAIPSQQHQQQTQQHLQAQPRQQQAQQQQTQQLQQQPLQPGGIRGAVAAMAAAAAAAAAAKASPGPGASGAAGTPAGKFVCPQCGKVVNSEGGLKKHMLVHGEKNFICPHPGCGKGFTDTGKLNKHMVVHATEKRWKCPLCAKPFVGEAYLKSHWKKSHKDVPMPAFIEQEPSAATAPSAAAAAGGSSGGGGGSVDAPMQDAS